MGHKPRYRPKRLAAKLLQIRLSLGLSQSQLARLLHVGVNAPRLCEYEKGTREPALVTLLAYGYLIGISTDNLIDDRVDLPAEIRIKPRRKTVDIRRTENI